MNRIFLALLLFASCGQSAVHYQKKGVRRDNRKELKIAAEMAHKFADGNFLIDMYGDTALVMGDHIIYKYKKELPENLYSLTIKMEEGVSYWAAPIGFKIGYNNYRWTVIKDTAFPCTLGQMTDTLRLFDLERIGVIKRDCICN